MTATTNIQEATVEQSVPTVQIRHRYDFDNGPTDFRLGLITLSSDYLMEYEFARLVSDPALSFHATRVRSVNPVTIENLRTMAPQITAAASLLPSEGLDVIGYYCTSGTIAIGDDAITDSIRKAHPSIPVATPIGGAVAGMRQLGMRRISLLTPYVDSVNQAVRAYLEAAGFEVLNIASFCLESDLDMYRLPPAAIRAAVIQHTHEQADGTFVSCTAIRAAETVAATEQTLSRPVVTAGQAFFWQLLRAAGYTRTIDGYGRLFHL